jgi:polysaccharide export outer membrane protein
MFRLSSLALILALASPLIVKADTPDLNAPPTVTDPSYRIAVGDHVSVTIHGEADMSGAQRVDVLGKIRLPYIGEVMLAGLSVRDAEQSLERLYNTRQLLKQPLVNITVVTYAVREVAILGAVRSPGNFQFPKEVTSLDVVDLVTRVGGFTATAKSDSVTVTRRMPDGKDSTFNLDVERMISGRRSGDSSRREFAILPGDRVWVPERLF